MARFPKDRINVSGYDHNGVTYRKLTKHAWGKLYRSMNEGRTWQRTSSEAFWEAFHASELTQMAPDDVTFLAGGGIILA